MPRAAVWTPGRSGSGGCGRSWRSSGPWGWTGGDVYYGREGWGSCKAANRDSPCAWRAQQAMGLYGWDCVLRVWGCC